MKPIRGFAATVAVAVSIALAGCGTDDPAGEEKADSSGNADDTKGSQETPDSLAFTATTVDGEKFDAAELAGEPVVLWFWAPWCPKCQAASDEVAAAAEDNPEVTIVGVAGLYDSVDNMSKFVDDHGVGELTHLADSDSEVWNKFEVKTQHTYALIDAEGEVTFTGSIADAELNKKIAELAG